MANEAKPTALVAVIVQLLGVRIAAVAVPEMMPLDEMVRPLGKQGAAKVIV